MVADHSPLMTLLGTDGRRRAPIGLAASGLAANQFAGTETKGAHIQLLSGASRRALPVETHRTASSFAYIPSTLARGHSTDIRGQADGFDETPLTPRREERMIDPPMARMYNAAQQLRGAALSSFGAPACRPGTRLHVELWPGRRNAEAGSPIAR